MIASMHLALCAVVHKSRKTVQISMKSVPKVPDVYGGQDLRKRKVLQLEKKNDGMMDVIRVMIMILVR